MIDRLYGWSANLDYLESATVVAVNRSALVVELIPGVSGFVSFVRVVDDAALALLREFHRPEWPVHLYEPSSLDRVGEIDSSEIIVTSSAPLDARPLYSIGPAVRRLTVTGMSCAPRSLRMSDLPFVESLAATWEDLDVGAGAGPSIRRLWLSDFPSDTLADVPGGADLTELGISGARRLGDLSGLSSLPGLRSLEISSARNLVDIGGVETSSELDVLALDACRTISTIDPVRRCHALTRLRLTDCGTIDSIEPLRNHPALQQFWAWGDTRIHDGDLSPLLTIAGLRDIALANRRSYRPSVNDVSAGLAASLASRDERGERWASTRACSGGTRCSAWSRWQTSWRSTSLR